MDAPYHVSTVVAFSVGVNAMRGAGLAVGSPVEARPARDLGQQRRQPKLRVRRHCRHHSIVLRCAAVSRAVVAVVDTTMPITQHAQAAGFRLSRDYATTGPADVAVLQVATVATSRSYTSCSCLIMAARSP